MKNFIAIIVILLGIVISDASLMAEDSQEPKPVRLTRIRSVIGKGYTAFVFMFDQTVPPQNPEIQGDEIINRFDHATTEIKARREYENLDSWVALESADGHLTARIGIPKDFSRMDHYQNRSRNKWIIRLYPKEPEDKSPPAESIHAEVSDKTIGRSEKGQATLPQKPENPALGGEAPKSMHKRETLTSNGLLTLNFFQSDIQEILSALAIEREINIATSKEVSGTISIHLYQVTLEEALNAIVLAGGFQYRKKDDLYYVYKPKDSRDPQADERQMKIYRLQYVETDKIESILKALPNMGTIQIHQPSQTLLVEDTPANIKKIETILSHWDRRPKQVLIEAKILEIDLTDEMTFGVDWAKVLGEFNIGTQGFSRATLPTVAPVSPLPGGDLSGVFGNLITAIGTTHQFSMALDALQTKTKVHTLSTPKVLAIHGKVAKVQVGGQQGYRVTTTNLGVATETIEFIDTGTILEITPYIDDTGRVLLNVLPSIQDAKIETGGIPVVKSTNVSTWLLAKSGETVFIGGLIKDKDEKARSMLPCFGSLPAVGTIFGQTVSRYNKSELVVMITPLIVGDEPQYVEQKEKEKVYREEEKFSKYPLPTIDQFREFIKPME